MTIQGALYELEQMLSRTDIPDYIKPTIKKVIETIVDELSEQQAFIKKPCVSEGVCREDKIQVLDKIRTEIAELEEGISSYHNDRPLVFKNEVLQIIDKYKESEGEE